MSILFKKTPKRKKNNFTAIDIGGSKVCCAIAKVDERATGENLKILGLGYQVSRGIKNGVITNLEELEDSILNAVHSAEQMANDTIREVYVNIAASSTKSHTVDVEVSLNGQAVDDSQIRQLMSLGRASFKNSQSQIIHVLPIAYALDDIEGIKDPRGLVGQKLTASLHIVSAQTSLMQNITNCIGRCHLNVIGFVVSSYASGLSILDDDELELGVTIVDLGGSSSSIASFLDGALVHIDSIPVGGSHITSDIARGLSTPLVQAERLKTLYGTTILSSADDRETIHVPQLGEGNHQITNQVSKSLLTQIIRARAEEMLELIWKQLQHSGMDRLVCQRVVLTGGCSQLPGMRELASSIWGKQIRIGYPKGVVGASDVVATPMFSTCAGLLKYALRDYIGGETQEIPSYEDGATLTRVIRWIRENF